MAKGFLDYLFLISKKSFIKMQATNKLVVLKKNLATTQSNETKYRNYCTLNITARKFDKETFIHAKWIFKITIRDS